jgi:hypothetical protein
MRRSTVSASRSFGSPSVHHERKRIKGGGRENFTAHLICFATQNKDPKHYLTLCEPAGGNGARGLRSFIGDGTQKKNKAGHGTACQCGFKDDSQQVDQRPKQRPPSNDMIEKLAAKIDTVLERGYLEVESIKSHIDVFPVTKADDIQAVYKGTKSGLNEAVWAPLFLLPTSKSALRVMTYCSFCVDLLDLGEMF